MRFLDYVSVNPKISLEKERIYPFVEMGDVSTSFRNPDKVEYKSFDSGVKFADGDTVIARITPCLQNGKRFYCKNIGKGFGSTEYLVFRPKDSSVDNLYLYYFMNTDFIKESMVRSMVGATGRQRVNNDVFSRLDVTFPNIEIQRRIAEILSTYDDLIENNRKQIKLLEEAAQRLYKEWFVDLRFPGHENTKITDGIPEGWHKTTLAEIAVIIKRGISPKYAADGKYTVINQKCIRGSIMDITESRKQEKQYEPILNIQDCDTVICSTGTGTLGRVGQIYGDYPNTTFDSHVTLVRAKENPNFMYQSIKNQQRFLMGMGHVSTNQQELYRNVIENVEVLLPDGSFLLQTEKLLSTFHDKIKTVYLQTSILTETRDRLLPKLMSGEIEHIS